MRSINCRLLQRYFRAISLPVLSRKYPCRGWQLRWRPCWTRVVRSFRINVCCIKLNYPCRTALFFKWFGHQPYHRYICSLKKSEAIFLHIIAPRGGMTLYIERALLIFHIYRMHICYTFLRIVFNISPISAIFV